MNARSGSLNRISYLLVLPLVAIGFVKLRERSIDTWGLVCAAIGLMPLVTPQSAIFNWQRWIMLLVVPYSYYAVQAYPSSPKDSDNRQGRRP